MMNDIEHLFAVVQVRAFPKQATRREMDNLLPFGRDLRVSDLLQAVVQEGVGMWIMDCELRVADPSSNPQSSGPRIGLQLFASLRSDAASSGDCSLTMASACRSKGFLMQDANVRLHTNRSLNATALNFEQNGSLIRAAFAAV